ncbi:MAG TPA: FtsX-like permease family protein, partial [Puia sp.]|nr:FtsX-like permease family protein [Puia sp.]
LSYDKFNPNAERTFRLTGQVRDIVSAQVPSAFAGAIKRDITGIKNTTRLIPFQNIITVGNRKFDEKHMYYADSNFLRIFNYLLLKGNAAIALTMPNSVVLTEATASKYFGSPEQAMGKTIEIDSNALLVTGILKNIPSNSHLQFDLLLPIENWDRRIEHPQPWRYFDCYTYFQLTDRINPDVAFVHKMERQLNEMRNKAIVHTQAVAASIFVQPLTDIHLHSHFRNDVDGQGNYQYVRIFMLVAIFIVFIACINFMNLATALSGTRAKEVGLRKTVGALRMQLISQFIGESILLSFISLILALLIVYFALPLFNEISSKSITLNLLDTTLIGKLLGTTILVGFLAGVYPAFYISSFNAIKVLKGVQIIKGGGNFLRNGLVVLQFSISVILMISTAVVYNQIHYLHNRDIGFNRENLLYVTIPESGDQKNNFDALRISLSQSSQIGDYTITGDLPTNLETEAPFTWRGMKDGNLVIAQWLNVDENFIRTFGMKMLAGRFYSGEFNGSDSEYVVNETAVKMMQMDPVEAVGKIISFRGHEGMIIGVVKDFNIRPAHQPIEPLIIRYRSSGNFLVIRTEAGNIKKTLASLQNSFQEIYGNNPFSYGFVDQDLDQLYRAESKMGKLFNIFSVLSIMISCLGLFGLAAFATQRRAREIGVRKVLGAGETGIVVLLAKEFLKLVIISLLIAFPVSWYVMNQWLRGYAYKTNISVWVFLSAGIITMLIAFLTVSYQTIRAAIANPVVTLRIE